MHIVKKIDPLLFFSKSKNWNDLVDAALENPERVGIYLNVLVRRNPALTSMEWYYIGVLSGLVWENMYPSNQKQRISKLKDLFQTTMTGWPDLGIPKKNVRLDDKWMSAAEKK